MPAGFRGKNDTRFRTDLLEATFLARENRFVARVRLRTTGETAFVHVANSGRLAEIFRPGVTVLLEARPGVGRRTAYRLALASLGKAGNAGELWVSVDAQLPNRLFEEALGSGRLLEFGGWTSVEREVRYGAGRFDFRIANGEHEGLVEVKSCTLVEDREARFPDAPTARGRRHLLELIDAREKGFRTAVVFIVQREDAAWFAPNRQTDPAFADTLYEAAQKGVEVACYRCSVNPAGVSVLPGLLPVFLAPRRKL